MEIGTVDSEYFFQSVSPHQTSVLHAFWLGSVVPWHAFSHSNDLLATHCSTFILSVFLYVLSEFPPLHVCLRRKSS